MIKKLLLIELVQKWYFKNMAKKVSCALIKMHGEKIFYSRSELEVTLDIITLIRKKHKYIYAMFSNEAVCDEFLSYTDYGLSAKELRFRLGLCIFKNMNALDYESTWNRFHDYDNLVLGGLKSLGRSGAKHSRKSGGYTIDSSGGYGGYSGD